MGAHFHFPPRALHKSSALLWNMENIGRVCHKKKTRLNTYLTIVQHSYFLLLFILFFGGSLDLWEPWYR